MGFFSGLTSTPKVNTPATGLYAQPKGYQDLYNTVLGNANSGVSGLNSQMFTPTGINPGEQNALNNIYAGFTPDANQLQSDISMLSNPYDEYVINGINREATGQNSLVNQAGAQAGQQGSNRSFLGTSDVEQNRLNNIGTFKQSQYNNAVNQSLGALSNSRRADATGALGGGTYERDLATQTQQAPYAALQAQQSLLAGIPTSFGNPGYQASSSGGNTDAATLLKTGAGLASFFSDENLKEGIVPVGKENGHNIYEFSYKNDPARHIGVMAQEVKKTHPDAVSEINGYLAVNYDMIGVKFQENV